MRKLKKLIDIKKPYDDLPEGMLFEEIHLFQIESAARAHSFAEIMYEFGVTDEGQLGVNDLRMAKYAYERGVKICSHQAASALFAQMNNPKGATAVSASLAYMTHFTAGWSAGDIEPDGTIRKVFEVEVTHRDAKDK